MEAAAEVAARASASLKRFARRFSLCAADAEDAYQRSLEILLMKAPTADRSELRAWLQTVIKHEALAIRRQRERTLVAGEASPEERLTPGAAPSPVDEHVGRRERARQTAEALSQLKQSELQCLLLKALGYSYTEIAERTGYSWTKVNRSLTEGRKRFLASFGEISSGERCERFAPLLSALCDGESTATQEQRLRAHLRGCSGCRASLREFRSAPTRLAELLPPGVLLPVLQRDGWWSRLVDTAGAGAAERAGALGFKLQQGAEVVGAHKAAAVMASTAALAGGAAVQHEIPDRPIRHHVAEASPEHRVDDRPAAPPADSNSPPAASEPAAPAQGEASPAPDPPPRDAAAAEFGIEGAAAAPGSAPAPVAEASSQDAPQGSATSFEWSSTTAGGGGAGGGEFGP